MATKIDKEACRESYNLVRDDNNDVNWVIFKYDGHMIVPDSQGTSYNDFKVQCTSDRVIFAFHRIITGDAMSKRAKFALITWIGDKITVLQRAKVSTDKSLVKEVVQNFAKEFVFCDPHELTEEYIKQELEKSGGANYDAQLE
ncbi:coactosin-like protein [Narcine bancroftii]|uniref:coactosin-like protein n=1 Tax=Narcine bancroftii TaxID=1343680 RepID=UPI003831797E